MLTLTRSPRLSVHLAVPSYHHVPENCHFRSSRSGTRWPGVTVRSQRESLVGASTLSPTSVAIIVTPSETHRYAKRHSGHRQFHLTYFCQRASGPFDQVRQRTATRRRGRIVDLISSEVLYSYVLLANIMVQLFLFLNPSRRSAAMVPHTAMDPQL